MDILLISRGTNYSITQDERARVVESQLANISGTSRVIFLSNTSLNAMRYNWSENYRNM
jgi:hypothetical protein